MDPSEGTGADCVRPRPLRWGALPRHLPQQRQQQQRQKQQATRNNNSSNRSNRFGPFALRFIGHKLGLPADAQVAGPPKTIAVAAPAKAAAAACSCWPLPMLLLSLAALTHMLAAPCLLLNRPGSLPVAECCIAVLRRACAGGCLDATLVLVLAAPRDLPQ